MRVRQVALREDASKLLDRCADKRVNAFSKVGRLQFSGIDRGCGRVARLAYGDDVLFTG